MMCPIDRGRNLCVRLCGIRLDAHVQATFLGFFTKTSCREAEPC